MEAHQIPNHQDALRFMFAGNAKFTVKNTETGNRYTFKVRAKKGSDDVHFVSVLTGPDNDSSYTFLGTVFNKSRYKHSAKSHIKAEATSAKVIAYVVQHLTMGTLPKQVMFWHEGCCGRCGRTLTVPESIETGMGPECAKIQTRQLSIAS